MQVNIDDPVPFFQRHVRRVAQATDTGAVDRAVKAAECLLGQFAGGRQVGKISDLSAQVAQLLWVLGGQRCAGLVIDIRDDGLAAMLGQVLNDRGANAGGTASHQVDFFAKIDFHAGHYTAHYTPAHSRAGLFLCPARSDNGTGQLSTG